jgi:ferrous-iron efflux pump FieF
MSTKRHKPLLEKAKIDLNMSTLFLVNSVLSLILAGISVLKTNSLTVTNDFLSYFMDIIFYFFMVLLIIKTKPPSALIFNYDIGKIEAITSLLASALIFSYVAILLKLSYDKLKTMEPFIYNADIFKYYAIMLVKNIGVVFVIKWLTKEKKSKFIENGNVFAISCIFENIVVLVPFFVYALHTVHSQSTIIYIDMIAALCLCLSNIYLIFPVLKTSVYQLLNKGIDENYQLRILAVLANHFDDYEYFLKQVTRQSGNINYIELHMGFDGKLLHSEVLDRADAIKTEIEEIIPHSVVYIIPSAHK